MILNHKPRAHQSAGFLVGVGHEDDVPFQADAFALELYEGHQLHCDHVFHVGGAATPNDAVMQVATERRPLPFVGLRRNDIDVAEKEDRRERAITSEPGDQISTARSAFNDRRLNALTGQGAGDEVDAGRFIAGWICCVYTQQILKQASRFGRVGR